MTEDHELIIALIIIIDIAQWQFFLGQKLFLKSRCKFLMLKNNLVCVSRFLN